MKFLNLIKVWSTPLSHNCVFKPDPYVLHPRSAASGKFCTQHELNSLSASDQHNTLIAELMGHTNQSGAHFQGTNNQTLAETGTTLRFMRYGRIRTDAQLKTMSDDNQCNTMVAELAPPSRRVP